MNSKTFGIDNRAYLGQLFKAAFGTVPVYLTIPIGKEKAVDLSGYNAELIEPAIYEDVERLSIYGTPIIFPVLFKGGVYNIYNSKGQVVKKEFQDLLLPGTTMVDFGRAKNIITTNMLGSNGTVKEIYGFDDWNIRIRTLCIKGDLQAREYVDRLHEFNEIIGAIEIESSIFSKKSIYSIVIDELNEKSLEGQPNVIPIEINCLSDEAIEFVITE